ncbi:MAG: TetR family transcriptional regulator C-terminal domain-containing protein [Clostridiales bacterium]|nr:TetR family transcriptional regulator C-terminal domain-containing protein [Clostridiales bacterium]
MPYLKFVSENRKLLKVVLGNPQVMQADKMYNSLIGDILNQILKRHNIPEKKREYMLSFYIKGIMGIIERWILSDCDDPAQDIANIR